MLTEKERYAVQALKDLLAAHYELSQVILFGSKARGDSTDESDIDLLILLNQTVTTAIEEDIFGLGFDVELEHDVVFGLIVKNTASWRDKEMFYPLGQNIIREGLAA